MTTPQEIESALGRVSDQSSFVQELLANALRWPVDSVESLEDISFGWTAAELGIEGLKKRVVDGEILQVRPFTADQPWGIFLMEFKNEDVFLTGRGMTGTLRKILQRLVPKQRNQPDRPSWKQEDLLFIATHKYKHFRFAYFKAPEGESKTAPMTSFGWMQGDTHVRTLCEYNLPALVFPNDEGEDGEAWLSQWAQAFDVDKVTKKFFEEYHTVFDHVESEVKGIPDAEKKRLYTQRLFNRLMFLYFIQKKGWLNYKGDEKYLHALFYAAEAKKEDFLNERLHPLFFNGLNCQREELNDSQRKVLVDKCGEVPYLNGGLFSMIDDYDQRDAVRIPNSAFRRVLDLFGRYNFTVTESTPLDVEVAVDPEMLGKVFEELVTGRHESGSYYTPRPVVSFMCREALKGYLASATGAENDAIAKLVDEQDAGSLDMDQARGCVKALDEMKAVDPACGSGAYLLGLLHEMIALYGSLFSAKLKKDARKLYDLKLRIITNNLYGVDIDEFAVGIARLRLWLSLAVDADDPLPLPNLDFKIEVGDSLTAPDPSGSKRQMDGFREAQVKEFDKLKGAFLKARSEKKKDDLLAEINAIRQELRKDQRTGKEVKGFDWRVEFAEVFASRGGVSVSHDNRLFVNELNAQQSMFTGKLGGEPGGFDIVLANPPYIRQELIHSIFGDEYKETLKKVYPKAYVKTADIYVAFYARGIQLLRSGGMLSFISSNKWFKAAYGKKLRGYVSDACYVLSITDFGDLPVFESATAYPMIFVAQKAKFTDEGDKVERDIATVITEPESLEPPYPDVLEVVCSQGRALAATNLNGEDWSFADADTAARLKKITTAGVPLMEYVSSRVYRGITTGCNKVFVVNADIRACLIRKDKRSKELIKPLVRGKDVERWDIQQPDLWVIFTRRGTNVRDFPAIRQYLDEHRERLEPRPRDWPADKEWPGRKPGSYAWYEIQDDIAYYREFDKLKIVSTKISIRPTFALDMTGSYLGNTAYFFPAHDSEAHFLLGILNSAVFFTYAKETFVTKQNGFYEVQPKGLEAFPVATASVAAKKAIGDLVQKCLDAKGEGCEEWEREIDERVARLYGLTDEKIAIVKGENL